MIQANELRIGNWVSHNGNQFQWSRENFFDIYYSTFDPIHLTPEILEKAGFENNIVWHLGKFEVGLDSEDFRNALMTVRYDNKVMIKVRSLHQLQNLYFALTGEELKISL